MRGVDYAIRVLKTQPKRFNFYKVTIPKRGECGCLMGLIGQASREVPDAVQTHGRI